MSHTREEANARLEEWMETLRRLVQEHGGASHHR